MSIRITWAPNPDADIKEYDIQRAPDVAGNAGTFVDLVTITHDLQGADYDVDSNRFFYVDETGVLSDWYQLRSRDIDNNESGYTDPYHPSTSSTPPPFPNTVQLHEDYGGTGDLAYLDPDGEPVEEAQIRVYKKVDYDLENYDAAIGVTTTDAAGGWVDPIIVTAGFTYTIHYFKPGALGPDTREVIVP